MDIENKLVGLAEAAQFLKISKNALSNIRRRDNLFPSPLEELSSGPLWRLKDIYDYGIKSNRISKEEIEMPKIKGNHKKIIILGRARTGKSFLTGMFCDNSIQYREIFCGSDIDKTQCCINHYFIDDTHSFIEFYSDFPSIYQYKYNELEECTDENNKKEIEEIIDLNTEIELISGIKVSLYDIDKIKDFVKKLENIIKRISNIENKNNKKSNTYINAYLKPSDFCRNIMKQNNTNYLEIVDTPGVSGDVDIESIKISKADLYIFLLRPDNKKEAETLKNIVKEIKPFVASSNVCFLYKKDGTIVDEEDYIIYKKEVKENMIPYEEHFNELKGNIISSTMDILNPAESCLLFPQMHPKKETLAEKYFKKDFIYKISTAFLGNNDEILRKNFNLSFKENNNNKEVENLVLEILKNIPKHNFNIFNKEYTKLDFINEKHDRVKTNDKFRIINDLNSAYKEEKNLLYNYFSKFTSDKYPKIWQQDVIKYLFNNLTKAIDNDCGLGIGNHYFEDYPPLTMFVEEAILSSDLYIEACKNSYKLNSSIYINCLINGGIKSKSWDYVNCIDYNLQPELFNKMLKKIDIIHNQLSKIKVSSRKEMILLMYIGGLRKLSEYIILTELKKPESECMIILNTLPF